MLPSLELEKFLKIGMEGLFCIITLVFVAFSLSLMYHWVSYGIHKRKIFIMGVTYFAFSAVLFISMAVSFNAI